MAWAALVPAVAVLIIRLEDLIWVTCTMFGGRRPLCVAVSGQ
jgi:hypothetical protein